MAKIGALVVCNLLVWAFAMQRALPAEYTLVPSPATVHIGNFNAALKPVLTINSGDTVTIETATQIDPADVDQSGAVSPTVVPEYVRTTIVRSRIAGLAPTSSQGRSSSMEPFRATFWKFGLSRSILPLAMATILNAPIPVRCRTNSPVFSGASLRSIAMPRPQRSRPAW